MPRGRGVTDEELVRALREHGPCTAQELSNHVILSSKQIGCRLARMDSVEAVREKRRGPWRSTVKVWAATNNKEVGDD